MHTLPTVQELDYGVMAMSADHTMFLEGNLQLTIGLRGVAKNITEEHLHEMVKTALNTAIAQILALSRETTNPVGKTPDPSHN